MGQFEIDNGKCVVPEGVTEIGAFEFKDCQNLKAVVIPKTITRIAFRAFANCRNLSHVTIPESVVEIHHEAFYGTGLTEVKLQEGVQTIGHGAFIDCTSLKAITIPFTVNYIGMYAFSGCTSLTSVRITNMTGIGTCIFKGCPIKDIYMESIPWSTDLCKFTRPRKSEGIQSSEIDIKRVTLHVTPDIENDIKQDSYFRKAKKIILWTPDDGDLESKINSRV